MEADQGNGLSIIPMKRTRGRPRKHPRPDHQVNAAPVPRYPNLNLRDSAAVPPPGFVRSNGNQAEQEAPTNRTRSANNLVGMPVSGVIEASFDAGYLLRISVGNTGTTLRGIVFKPGHYAPVVPENDVAPDAKRIQRYEVPLPFENHSSIHVHKPHYRDASRSVLHVASEGRQAPVSALSVSQIMPRGNLTPVVLEPCKASNGVALVAPQATTVSTLKREDVVSAAPSNGCPVSDDQASLAQNQMQGSQPHTGHQVMDDVKMIENGHINPPAVEELPKTEVKPMTLPENVHTESAESHITATNLPDQPLVVEPKDHPTTTSEPMEDVRNDKMFELLQVLQDSMKERVNDETEKLFGDGQNEDSSTPSQAS